MRWVERAAGGYLSHVARDGRNPFRYRTRVAELLGRPGSEVRPTRRFPPALPPEPHYRRAHPCPDIPADPPQMPAMPEKLDCEVPVRAPTLARDTLAASAARVPISSTSTPDAPERSPDVGSAGAEPVERQGEVGAPVVDPPVLAAPVPVAVPVPVASPEPSREALRPGGGRLSAGLPPAGANPCDPSTGADTSVGPGLGERRDRASPATGAAADLPTGAVPQVPVATPAQVRPQTRTAARPPELLNAGRLSHPERAADPRTAAGLGSADAEPVGQPGQVSVPAVDPPGLAVPVPVAAPVPVAVSESGGEGLRTGGGGRLGAGLPDADANPLPVTLDPVRLQEPCDPWTGADTSVGPGLAERRDRVSPVAGAAADRLAGGVSQVPVDTPAQTRLAPRPPELLNADRLSHPERAADPPTPAGPGSAGAEPVGRRGEVGIPVVDPPALAAPARAAPVPVASPEPSGEGLRPGGGGRLGAGLPDAGANPLPARSGLAGLQEPRDPWTGADTSVGPGLAERRDRVSPLAGAAADPLTGAVPQVPVATPAQARQASRRPELLTAGPPPSIQPAGPQEPIGRLSHPERAADPRTPAGPGSAGAEPVGQPGQVSVPAVDPPGLATPVPVASPEPSGEGLRPGGGRRLSAGLPDAGANPLPARSGLAGLQEPRDPWTGADTSVGPGLAERRDRVSPLADAAADPLTGAVPQVPVATPAQARLAPRPPELLTAGPPPSIQPVGPEEPIGYPPHPERVAGHLTPARSHASEGAQRQSFSPEPRLSSRHRTDAASIQYPRDDTRPRTTARRPASAESVPTASPPPPPSVVAPPPSPPPPRPPPARIVQVRSESRPPRAAYWARLYVGRVGLRGLR